MCAYSFDKSIMHPKLERIFIILVESELSVIQKRLKRTGKKMKKLKKKYIS